MTHPRHEIRSYRESDRQGCLSILDGNTPEFFAAKDREEYAAFLDRLPGPYFVIEGNSPRACGGWALDYDGVAVLTWGMVRRDLHRRRIGTALLQHRLHRIGEDSRAGIVRVRTIQVVRPFFEREGFQVVDVTIDGFGPGLDRVTMQLELWTGRPSEATRSE